MGTNYKERLVDIDDFTKVRLADDESQLKNINIYKNIMDYFDFKKKSLSKLTLIKTNLKAIFILIIFISFFHHKNLENSCVGFSTEIMNDDLHGYLVDQYANKFNLYMETCLKNNLLEKENFTLSVNPKITVTMPVYNGEKYLNYSLRSIQNQKMKDIEILLIDDCSTDNSVKIIKEYMKDDPRIRLIKNEKNRRILYSKSIAALNANGKYITQIDQDDMFIRDDAFDLLINEAEKNDIDLVQFRDFVLDKFHFNEKASVNQPRNHLIYPHIEKYETQPDLKNKLFGKDYNFLLWGLLIKADLYKKAVYHMWPLIANYKLIFHEDYTITFLLVILARNFKFLNNFCYIHLEHKNQVSYDIAANKEFFFGVLFFSCNLYKYYIKDHPQEVKLLTNSLFQDGNDKRFHNHFPELFKFLFRNVLDSDYLTYEEKEKIRKKYDIANEEYKIWNTYEYFMDIEQYNSISSYQNSLLIQDKKGNNPSYIKPKYSFVIYSTEYDFLENTIISIENQIYNNYEIVLVYDNNNKNELQKIEKFVSEYININLINNKEKKGIFYSYSSGILEAKGDYILSINSGATLATKNVLKDINNYIENDDEINILEFNLLNNKYDNVANNSLSLYKCEHFKSEINIDFIKFNEHFRSIDLEKELMMNKLIKADLYKNLIREFKLKQDDNRIYNYFNDILYFLISKKGFEIKKVDDFGIIQYINKVKSFELNGIMKDKSQLINDTLFYINFLFDNSDNTFESKKYVLNEYNTLLSVIYNKFNIISDEAKQLYNKFINCDFLSQYDKNNLKMYYESLIN